MEHTIFKPTLTEGQDINDITYIDKDTPVYIISENKNLTTEELENTDIDDRQQYYIVTEQNTIGPFDNITSLEVTSDKKLCYGVKKDSHWYFVLGDETYGPYDDIKSGIIEYNGMNFAIGANISDSWYVITRNKQYGPYGYIENIHINPDTNKISFTYSMEPYSMETEHQNAYYLYDGDIQLGPYYDFSILYNNKKRNFLIYQAKLHPNDTKYYLFAGTKKIGSFNKNKDISKIKVLSDRKSIAYIKKDNGANKDTYYLVKNNEKLGPYDYIDDNYIISPEGNFVFCAKIKNYWFIIKNNIAFGPFNYAKQYKDSYNGIEKYAFWIRINKQYYIITENDKYGPYDDVILINNRLYINDRNIFYIAKIKDSYFVYAGEKRFGPYEDFCLFSSTNIRQKIDFGYKDNGFWYVMSGDDTYGPYMAVQDIEITNNESRLTYYAMTDNTWHLYIDNINIAKISPDRNPFFKFNDSKIFNYLDKSMRRYYNNQFKFVVFNNKVFGPYTSIEQLRFVDNENIEYYAETKDYNQYYISKNKKYKFIRLKTDSYPRNCFGNEIANIYKKNNNVFISYKKQKFGPFNFIDFFDNDKDSLHGGAFSFAAGNITKTENNEIYSFSYIKDKSIIENYIYYNSKENDTILVEKSNNKYFVLYKNEKYGPYDYMVKLPKLLYKNMITYIYKNYENNQENCYLQIGNSIFGPYNDISYNSDFDYLPYYMAEKNDKTYLLDKLNGNEYGPMDEVVDDYCYIGPEDKPQSVFYFRVGDAWYLICGSEKFGPYDEIGYFISSRDDLDFICKIKKNNQWFLLSGKDQYGPFDEIDYEIFSNFHKIIIYSVKIDGKWYMINGTEKDGPYDEIRYYPHPDSTKIFVYTVKIDEKWYIIKGTEKNGPYDEIYNIQYYEDSGELIYMFKNNNQSYLVYNNTVVGPYDDVDYIRCKTELVYKARQGTAWYLCAGTEQFGPFNDINDFYYSAVYKKLMYEAKIGKYWYFFIGSERFGPYEYIDYASIGGDDTHFLYPALIDNQWYIIYDHERIGPFDYIDETILSPDGTKIAYVFRVRE